MHRFNVVQKNCASISKYYTAAIHSTSKGNRYYYKSKIANGLSLYKPGIIEIQMWDQDNCKVRRISLCHIAIIGIINLYSVFYSNLLGKNIIAITIAITIITHIWNL